MPSYHFHIRFELYSIPSTSGPDQPVVKPPFSAAYRDRHFHCAPTCSQNLPVGIAPLQRSANYIHIAICKPCSRGPRPRAVVARAVSDQQTHRSSCSHTRMYRAAFKRAGSTGLALRRGEYRKHRHVGRSDANATFLRQKFHQDWLACASGLHPF